MAFSYINQMFLYKELSELLQKISTLKVGLIGDACVDIYWNADMRLSELSRETPHHPLPIVSERFSLGAAGNVAANLQSLGIEELKFVSCYGNDWRKNILFEQLKSNNISNDYMVESQNFVTPAYCKPMRHGISDVVYEDPRLDFENRQPLSTEEESKLIEQIDNMAKDVDIIAVSDQFQFGCVTQRVREKIISLNNKIIVDSRNQASEYKNVIIKPNEVETLHLTGIDIFNGDFEKNILSAAKILFDRTQKPIIITLGEKGSFYFDGNNSCLVPSLKVESEIDFVGAGDAFLAGLTCALGAGATASQALLLGNMCSFITIQKIGMTGTASQNELLNMKGKLNANN